MDRFVGDNPLVGWAVWFGMRATALMTAVSVSAFVLL